MVENTSLSNTSAGIGGDTILLKEYTSIDYNAVKLISLHNICKNRLSYFHKKMDSLSSSAVSFIIIKGV